VGPASVFRDAKLFFVSTSSHMIVAPALVGRSKCRERSMLEACALNLHKGLVGLSCAPWTNGFTF